MKNEVCLGSLMFSLAVCSLSLATYWATLILLTIKQFFFFSSCHFYLSMFVLTLSKHIRCTIMSVLVAL